MAREECVVCCSPSCLSATKELSCCHLENLGWSDLDLLLAVTRLCWLQSVSWD